MKIILLNILLYDLYTRTFVWTICQSPFSILLETSSKHECINCFFCRQKSLLMQFILTLQEQKEVLFFWVLKQSIVKDAWQLALLWWKMIWRCLFVFLISLKTLGKRMTMRYSELTVIHSFKSIFATWPIFPKKRGDHLLGSDLNANNFCGIYFI